MFIDATNIISTIRQTIVGTVGQEFIDGTRIPMTFTSTKRLRLIDPKFASVITSTNNVEALLERGAFTVNTSKAWQVSTMPVIEMAVNPNSIEWKQNKRIVKRDTQEGSTFFHFCNSKGQNNDILTMSFRGNSGYINYRGDIATSMATNSQPQTIKKLMLWHNLWNLTREEKLLPDGTQNEFMIMYSSPIIPTNIMLVGFFSNVLDWTDSAEKPFSKDYSFGFTVEDSIPSLDDLVQDLSIYMINAESGIGVT